MDIDVNQIAITLPVQLGELNKKKQDIIFEKVLKNTKFENIATGPFGLLCYTKDGKENLVINIDRIAYNKSGNNIDASEIKNVFNKIFDVLLLDSNNFAIIDVQGIVKAQDSHKESLDQFNDKFNKVLDEYPDVYGVGYRFVTKTIESNGEFKVEPLLQNSSYYFCQKILNYNINKIPIDKIINITENIVNDFNEYFSSILKIM